MHYRFRKLAAVSLAMTAACSAASVGASATETRTLQVAQIGGAVTPLPEIPGKPVVLPDQSGAPAPAATMQGLVPATGSTNRPGAVPVPARSSTAPPAAQPIAGAGAPSAH